MRDPDDHLTFFRALGERPFEHDFFQALRRIECLYPRMPRIGAALRPVDEPVRLGQEAFMTFAPSPLASFAVPRGASVPCLKVRFFGLLGPNGPLPLHLTEFARDRANHADDDTLIRFLDLFHHRFLCLFYRAWAQAQPGVCLDRPVDDRYAVYTASLFGMGEAGLRQRDAVGDHAKLFFCGLLSRQVRNREGLVAILSGFFCLPVAVEEYTGHWMRLPDSERSRLGQASAGLGSAAVLGRRVWDCQHKIRIRIGPLDLTQYQDFLPGGLALTRLVAWMRQYLCFELDWDVRLVLQREAVPPCRPGRFGQLGWTTWLGKYRSPDDASDLTLDAERLTSCGADAPA